MNFPMRHNAAEWFRVILTPLSFNLSLVCVSGENSGFLLSQALFSGLDLKNSFHFNIVLIHVPHSARETSFVECFKGLLVRIVDWW